MAKKSKVLEKKLPDLETTRVGKYFVAVKKGKTKKEAALQAGINPSNTSAIENTEGFKMLERVYLKDVMSTHITLDEVAAALADNIKQEGDRGARNKAIEIYRDTVEPEEKPDDTDDQVVIVLAKR
jgi:hypothetical protein